MIPLFKPFINKRCLQDLKEVIYSGYIGEGPRVKEFEKLLSEHLNGYVVLVNSATSALHLALHITGVKGKDVVSTPMTCMATNTPILQNGARIIWADVDTITGNIDPLSVARRITWNTKAVMCVHYGGNLCDSSLKEICDKRNVTLIEDCAHLNDKGLNGLQCYSFQAIKHITTGDGGALVTQNKRIYERAKLLRWYGIDRESGATMRCMAPVHEAGYKFHMNDIAACIGISNFHCIREIVGKTLSNAEYYNVRFDGLPGIQLIPVKTRNDYWLYILLVDNKEDFMTFMKDNGIETSLVHARNDLQPIFKSSKCKLPGLESFWARQVCIPVGWWLSPQDREFIADKVVEFAQIRTD
jgi:dTDP-4-amino-4,6-dideoxygalactose transaminase